MERPTVDVVRLVDDAEYRATQLGISITTKSTEWAHEQEVRFLARQSGPKIYNRDLLTRIIFGVDTPESSITFIQGLLTEAGVSPELTVCRPDESSYAIHLEQI